MLAQLPALRTHDVRALFSLERLSSAALFQEIMVCSLGKKKKKKIIPNAQNAVALTCAPASLPRSNRLAPCAQRSPDGDGTGATALVSVRDERQHVNSGRGNNM